jgi:hypothetical protein
MEIRTLAPDQLITEPGFYSIPLSQHHSQPCDGPSVTSGVLRKMETHTPLDVWSFHKLNPYRWEQTQTDALRLGVAMALYCEGGADRVLEGFKVHPDDKPRRPTAAQIEAYDAGKLTPANEVSVPYWRAVDAEPSAYLDAKEFDLIKTMGWVLEKDPAAKAVMGGIPEVTMAYRDAETGLWILSRPDTVSFDGTVSDYKKVAASGKPFNAALIDQRITQFAYDMQLALAATAFNVLTGEKIDVAGIVAQSDTAPHHVILREIAEEDLQIGAWRNQRQIRRFAECLASGVWPGPGDEVGAYRRPPAQRDKLLSDMGVAA